jgi:hypothetical protein
LRRMALWTEKRRENGEGRVRIGQRIAWQRLRRGRKVATEAGRDQRDPRTNDALVGAPGAGRRCGRLPDGRRRSCCYPPDMPSGGPTSPQRGRRPDAKGSRAPCRTARDLEEQHFVGGSRFTRGVLPRALWAAGGLVPSPPAARAKAALFSFNPPQRRTMHVRPCSVRRKSVSTGDRPEALVGKEVSPYGLVSENTVHIPAAVFVSVPIEGAVGSLRGRSSHIHGTAAGSDERDDPSASGLCHRRHGTWGDRAGQSAASSQPVDPGPRTTYNQNAWPGCALTA